MIKKALATDQVRDSPIPYNIVLVQVYSGLDRAQFTFAFRPKPSFDEIFECKY